jgi:RNA polymerase sigma-70 factor (ECF subfamily)
MRKITQLREPACFGAWLRRITVRVAINRGMRRPPLPTAESTMLEAHAQCAESPLEDVAREEGRARVRQAVAALRDIDREALDAFYLRGLSLVEIAAEFNIPVGTIKRRLHTARRRLEESLSESRPREVVASSVAKRSRERELMLAE